MFSSGRSNATDSSDDQSFIDVFDFDDNDSERWLVAEDKDVKFLDNGFVLLFFRLCSVPVETASVGNKSDDLKAWLSSVDQEAGPSSNVTQLISTNMFTQHAIFRMLESNK